ncbi:Uncharacterised protein [Bordetella pseudohinzii]|uniref:Uncharacterized protein n=1 Tax=Bordetella pseudohinzii TaxID=1331258 RepID=A0A0M7D8H1_9BORD|nr:Uncharacterised protein [Bordetella pseudohinzii]
MEARHEDGQTDGGRLGAHAPGRLRQHQRGHGLAADAATAAGAGLDAAKERGGRAPARHGFAPGHGPVGDPRGPAKRALFCFAGLSGRLPPDLWRDARSAGHARGRLAHDRAGRGRRKALPRPAVGRAGSGGLAWPGPAGRRPLGFPRGRRRPGARGRLAADRCPVSGRPGLCAAAGRRSAGRAPAAGPGRRAGSGQCARPGQPGLAAGAAGRRGRGAAGHDAGPAESPGAQPRLSAGRGDPPPGGGLGQ